MPKPYPFLWFDTQAEEAANHYISIFPNSRMTAVSRYGKGGPGPEGGVMVAAFELDGARVTALNGGPMFKFTEAVSLVVECETQADIDHFYDRLVEGGTPSMCGWLKDKFGLSWQVVPTALPRLMSSGDAAASGRVMQAMLQMRKLDLPALEKAFAG